VIEFADIHRFNPDVLQLWAQDVTGCVTQIDSLISTVADKGSVDQFGVALNVVGRVAVAARARAGFSTAGLLSVLRQADTTLVATLAPVCSSVRVAEPGTPIVEIQYTCTAYNGDSACADQIIRRGRPPLPPTPRPERAGQPGHPQHQPRPRPDRAAAHPRLTVRPAAGTDPSPAAARG
jgi:hypothetical protein